jgi:surface protein
MNNFFSNNAYFNEDITTWDTSNVTDMASMFYNCPNFNQNISYWDVSNVTTMQFMFITSFFSVSNNDGSSHIFTGSIFNQPIGSWNTSKVTNMAGMFQNTINFNADISTWDVSNLADVYYMFQNVGKFNQDLSGWDLLNYPASSYYLFLEPSNSVFVTSNRPTPKRINPSLQVVTEPPPTIDTQPVTIVVSSLSEAPFICTSSNTRVATVSAQTTGNQLTLTLSPLSPGSTTITVIQNPYINSDGTKYAGGKIERNITVEKATSVITLSDINKTVDDINSTFDLNATSNSDGAISYSISSDYSSVATVSGSTVTIVGAGTAVINVTQAPTKRYTNGSTSVQLNVSKRELEISFSQYSINKNFGDSPFDLNAVLNPTSNSNGEISYSILSEHSSIATLSGSSTVTIVGAGNATIIVTIAETTNYQGGSTSVILIVAPANE